MPSLHPLLPLLLLAACARGEEPASAGAMAEEEAGISLAGPWRARLVHPLPPAPNYELAHPVPPISPEALAGVQVEADDRDWDVLVCPTTWDHGPAPWTNADGEAVFRRTVDIPAALAGRALELRLGPIDDVDDTYVNGVRVGGVGKQVPGHWAKPRIYRVPAALVTPGRMVIAVRVFDIWGGGGFTGAPADMVLRLVPPRAK